MTGKEALEKLLDDLKYWQGRNTIFDKVHSKHILDELELLEKYKRAFEILKEKTNIKLSKGNLEEDNWYEVGCASFGCIHYTDITKEEYELLEELMSDGKIN